MRIRFVGATEIRLHLAQREICTPAVVERETGLEIRLRLAPQLRPLAQAAERVQQRCILVVVDEPSLGRLQLPCRVGGRAFGVERDKIRVPAPVETARNDVGRFAIAAQRDERAGCGTCDLGLQLFSVGKPIPIIAQPRGIVREAGERFGMRTRPEHLALRRIVDPALHQLIDQRGNLGVPSCRRQRA